MVIEGYRHISGVISEAQQKLVDIRSGKFKPLFSSSKKETDKIGGFYPSDQIVIGARPGTGKTAEIIQKMTDFCDPVLNPFYQDKLMILYDSWEMGAWRNVLRMISREGSVPVKELLDHAKALEEERFNRLILLANKFKNYPIFISTQPLTVTKWLETKKKIQGKYPHKYIVNCFDHTRLILKSEESKEEEKLTALMWAGVELKNNFNMINIFLSQLNRNIETGVNRDKMGMSTPVASDFFGGDSVYQAADIVIALHRPGVYGLERFEDIPTGIDKSDPDKQDNLLIKCVLKQREGWTGNLFMKHNLAHNKIEDYDIKALIQQNKSLF